MEEKKRLVKQLMSDLDKPIEMFCSSEAAVKLAENPDFVYKISAYKTPEITKLICNNDKLLHYNDGSFTNRDKFIKTMNDKSDDDKLLSNHKRSVSLKHTYKERGEQINDAKCNTKLIKYGNPTYNNRTKFIETYNNKKDLYATIASFVFKKDYWECMEHWEDGSPNPTGKGIRSKAKGLVLGKLKVMLN